MREGLQLTSNQQAGAGAWDTWKEAEEEAVARLPQAEGVQPTLSLRSLVGVTASCG